MTFASKKLNKLLFKYNSCKFFKFRNVVGLNELMRLLCKFSVNKLVRFRNEVEFKSVSLLLSNSKYFKLARFWNKFSSIASIRLWLRESDSKLINLALVLLIFQVEVVENLLLLSFSYIQVIVFTFEPCLPILNLSFLLLH